MTAAVENRPQPPSVLSTLNPDGSRRWIKPRPSNGRFLTRRRVVAYALIALFAVTPFIKIGGKPIILLNVVAREFTFFGKTFFPTDTLLLALLMMIVFVTIFLFTALFGRVWCGWACPQTVYMEFLFRPIERFFEGTPGRAKKGFLQGSGAGRLFKYVAYFVVSLHLAHTFLSWFVGVDRLWEWSHRSPFEHPAGFLIVLVVTALMMFDFCYFREQTCIVACPYGRFQSALLDRNSLIVSYDRARGEPRGRAAKGPARSVALPVMAEFRAAPGAAAVAPAESPRAGDCVDCGLCVATCPTGIDIRNGLQMECINCTQCIDACDAVMTKLNRPRGLVRYSSQAAMEGEKKSLIRPRVLVYPALLAILLTAFLIVLSTKGNADIGVMRGAGRPFTQLDSGEISNPVRVKIRNRDSVDRSYTVDAAGAPGARIIIEGEIPTLKPGEVVTLPAAILAPGSTFVHGTLDLQIKVADSGGYTKTLKYRMMGPGTAVHPGTPTDGNAAPAPQGGTP